MNELCGKCKKKNKEPIINCSGDCNMIYHLKCVKIQSTDYDVVQNCRGIKWFCDTCIETLERVWGLKKDISNLQKQVSSELIELKSMINKIHSHPKDEVSLTEKKSYAKAASEVVIIKPKNTGQDSKKTLETVQKYVSPTTLEVGITEIKAVKEGGVVIKCGTKEEINKVKIAAEKKLGKNYKINAPDLKSPSIKIIDIDREMTSDELLDTIKKQNLILNHNSVSLNLKALRKMKTKWMAIVECDPESFRRIMDQNGLFIDWSRCRVYEYVSIFRCFKCGGFGHKADHCSNDSRCLSCAKPVSEHENGEKCESDTPKCINCIDANAALKTDFNVNHSVYDVSCPIFLKKIEIERQKIKYNINKE